MPHIAETGAIAHQSAGQGVLTPWEDCRERVAGGQRRELFRVAAEEGTGNNHNRTDALLRKSREGRFEIAFGSGILNNE